MERGRAFLRNVSQNFVLHVQLDILATYFYQKIVEPPAIV